MLSHFLILRLEPRPTYVSLPILPELNRCNVMLHMQQKIAATQICSVQENSTESGVLSLGQSGGHACKILTFHEGHLTEDRSGLAF